jgi:hypothetical protein
MGGGEVDSYGAYAPPTNTYSCECLEGYMIDLSTLTSCVSTSSPTGEPTKAPTQKPTKAESLSLVGEMSISGFTEATFGSAAITAFEMAISEYGVADAGSIAVTAIDGQKIKQTVRRLNEKSSAQRRRLEEKNENGGMVSDS